jgi:hypothetical protein
MFFSVAYQHCHGRSDWRLLFGLGCLAMVALWHKYLLLICGARQEDSCTVPTSCTRCWYGYVMTLSHLPPNFCSPTSFRCMWLTTLPINKAILHYSARLSVCVIVVFQSFVVIWALTSFWFRLCRILLLSVWHSNSRTSALRETIEQHPEDFASNQINRISFIFWVLFF